MMTLAAKRGYSMRRTEDLIQELGTAITSKMQSQHRNNVYQMIAFNITGFPQQLFGRMCSPIVSIPPPRYRILDFAMS